MAWPRQYDIGLVDDDWIAWLMREFVPFGGFTANRFTGSVYNIYKEGGDSWLLYNELAQTVPGFKFGPCIYIISLTDNPGFEINENFRHVYREAARKFKRPLVGHWILESAHYLDVSVAVQYIREDAINLGHEHGQKAIIELGSDGAYDHVKLQAH